MGQRYFEDFKNEKKYNHYMHNIKMVIPMFLNIYLNIQINIE